MLRRPLHQQCRALVKSLVVPDPWDIEEFCAHLQHSRGRVLKIMPPIPVQHGAPCGLCIPTNTADYVFTVETSRYHREHIALHEIGHLLCGHEGGGLSSTDVAELLLPSLDPAVVARVLGRTAYSSVQEQEAEYFATLVLARARPADAPTAAEPHVAEVLDRLEGSWGRPFKAAPRASPMMAPIHQDSRAGGVIT